MYKKDRTTTKGSLIHVALWAFSHHRRTQPNVLTEGPSARTYSPSFVLLLPSPLLMNSKSSSRHKSAVHPSPMGDGGMAPEAGTRELPEGTGF
jgi:hypothetical protein